MRTEAPLDQLLRQIGWTRRGLAVRLNIGVTSLRRWDTGETSIPPTVKRWLTRLADAHNRNPTPTLDQTEFPRRMKR